LDDPTLILLAKAQLQFDPTNVVVRVILFNLQVKLTKVFHNDFDQNMHNMVAHWHQFGHTCLKAFFLNFTKEVTRKFDQRIGKRQKVTKNLCAYCKLHLYVMDLEDVKVWVVKTTSLMIVSRIIINFMNQELVKGIILNELKVIDIV
jgi:hypothetical protein